MNNKELHVLSTGRQPVERLVETFEEIHPYLTALHIREKEKTAREIYQLVEQLRTKNVPLSKIVINDRVDVAQVMRVQGTHLAYHSLPIDQVKEHFPQLRVGCSVHSLEEALRAQAQGADYVTFGHIFETQSKPGVNPRGLEQLRTITASVTIPVIGIGGIQPSHVQSVVEAGADGIAVMSGILEAENPLEMVKEYNSRLVDRKEGFHA
ncbi:thiazole tautomerase TenI [Radiobacillus deserti]|uniref:Thiamine-phosphate synthase n=1 Tax=Radiobacillus deserti TaxID=2594883 RepID=A0A516KDM9_9BACI|nr:thiazole tautomerase TenI [Radiobacillus deserti]QDP39480.1 thiazole tautomerase TenI [Radiobacillus deserti]